MRHLTDEEAKIYESWLEKESIPTGITLSDIVQDFNNINI